MYNVKWAINTCYIVIPIEKQTDIIATYVPTRITTFAKVYKFSGHRCT